MPKPSHTTRAEEKRRQQVQQDESTREKATRERSSADDVNRAQEPSLGGELNQEATIGRLAALLSDPEVSRPVNAMVKSQIVRKLQSDHGNQYVQRLVNHITARRKVQTKRIQRQEAKTTQPQIALEGGDVIQRKGGLKGFLAGLFTSSREEEEVTSEVDYDMAIEEVKKISRALGSGISGYVYKAELQDDRDVAMKTPKDAGQAKVLIAEAELMKKMPTKVENLIKYIGLAERKGNPALIMELAPSGNLDVVSKKIRDDSDLADKDKELALMHLFKGALTGLAALHMGNLTHGDIKGENILVGADGESKIADIGTTTLSGKEPLGVGTEGYLAPERRPNVKGTRPSKKSDVWALGTTIEGAGQGLFKGNPEFKNLLHGLLAKDPKDRPYAEQAAQHPFFEPLNTAHDEEKEGGKELNQAAEELRSVAKELVLGLDEQRKRPVEERKEQPSPEEEKPEKPEGFGKGEFERRRALFERPEEKQQEEKPAPTGLGEEEFERRRALFEGRH